MSQLIKRERAHHYLFFVIIGFALTVLGVRSYLILFNYPQLGSGNVHIAHVLWGGLLLTIAALLLLIFSNARAYIVSALFTGSGLGLFIDEVGKFLTENNNYFFRPAAPIIYMTFLFILFLYVYVKRKRTSTTKELFYGVLDNCKEIVENNLDPIEKKQLEEKLEAIVVGEKTESIKGFAQALQKYIKDIDHQQEKRTHPIVQKFYIFREKIKSYKNLHKGLFYLLLILLGIRSIGSILNLSDSWILLFQQGEQKLELIQELVRDNTIQKSRDVSFLIMQTIAEGAVGMFIVAGIMLRSLRKERGIRIIKMAMLFSICSVDVVAFYLNQFNHISSLVVDLLIIGYVIFFEQLFTQEIE